MQIPFQQQNNEHAVKTNNNHNKQHKQISHFRYQIIKSHNNNAVA